MIPYQAARSGAWLKYSAAAVAIVMDGNSLVYGYRNPGPGNTIAQQVVSQAASPLFGSGITVANIGVNGQTWSGMLSSLPAFVGGKTNVVIAWEGTNSIQGGRTAAQAIQDATDYITAVHAANSGFRVVVMTCLPRQGGFAPWGTIAAFNAEIDTYNATLRSSHMSMGAVALCDVRKGGGVFDMAGDYTNAQFAACNTRAGATVWLEPTTGSAIHLTDAGDAVVASMLADTLRRVRA